MAEGFFFLHRKTLFKYIPNVFLSLSNFKQTKHFTVNIFQTDNQYIYFCKHPINPEAIFKSQILNDIIFQEVAS